MRAARLLTILITLQTRGRATAQSLADQLEVSKRTIYRDVDELSAAGVPIYAERGRAGGLALLDGFRTDLTGFTDREAEVLLLAGVPGAAADLGLGGEVSAARIKLLAAIPPASVDAVRRIGDRFHLDPIDWYRQSQPPKHLEVAARCVWESRRLAIEYRSWTRTSRSVIEPLGLILKAGRWYVLAAGKKPRAYRLENIREASATDQLFDRPERFDLASAWRQNVQSFEASLHRFPVTLRVAPSTQDRLYRLGDAIAGPLRSAKPDAGGWREAVVPMESIDHAAGLLLGFADEVEVLAPAALRDAIAERAAAVIRLYRRFDSGSV